MTESRGNDGELRDWAWYKPERGRRCDRKKMPSETQIIGFQTALAHQELRTSLRW
ncbi:hypothetical protein [Neisseria meningitidis]|uniref:hypothetical protein n=1 Tax=Neisseria meningitidis TaxID=487 RepID=UPI001864AA02|nr:hypothetical protein [Neisseria meningitidis]